MNWQAMIPEWISLAVFLWILIAELIRGEKSDNSNARAHMTVSITGIFAILIALIPMAAESSGAFNGIFINDLFSVLFKGLLAGTVLFILPMAYQHFRKTSSGFSEFLLVLWISLIGMFFLVSARDFLLMFISLEIVTLSFYIMAAYSKKELFSIEAGLKYLILGSLASAFMIFGIALLYVVTGSTAFDVIRQTLAADSSHKLMALGILLILSAVGFKIAAVPFQLWVPDVYQGSPTPVVAFLAVGSKGAGIALLLRLTADVFGALVVQHTFLFSVLAAMTILYGNFGAILQTNIKRLFAYSSIGHAGYLLIGIAAGGIAGTTAVIYYFLAYAVTNLCAFFVINYAGQAAGGYAIQDFRGLSTRSPFLAAAFFISLLSLAGIPPLAGFFGKFLVLWAAVTEGITWLALLGALIVAVSLYYYLNIARALYVDESAVEEPIMLSLTSKVILSFLVFGIIFIGFYQAPFYNLARHAAQAVIH